MEQTTAVQPLQRSSATLATVLDRRDQLGFPLMVIGRSAGPIVAQRVGAWWMQPLTDPSTLPSRARHRLEALVASGVRPKGVVVFHELTAPARRQPTLWERRSAQATQWVQQELPIVAERAGRTIGHHAPIVGRFALNLSLAIAGGLAAMVWTTAGAIAEAVISDPCLVIVTEDGYWVEIDRWYS